MFSGSWSQTPGEHSLNSFLCGCSPEGGSRHRENIPGAGFCVNVLRRVVPDTRRTLAEHIFAWMFSGGWFRTPGEHYWNCECSPEGGSRHQNVCKFGPNPSEIALFAQELEPRGAQIDQNGAREVPRGDIGGPNGTEDGQRSPGEKCTTILGGILAPFWRSFWGHFWYFLASFLGLDFGIDFGVIFDGFWSHFWLLFGDGTGLGKRNSIL